MRHVLHETVAEVVEDALNSLRDGKWELKRSPECKGDHALPLFRGGIGGHLVEYCDVDLIVKHGGEARLIVEIEESEVKPNQILGKVITSTLSERYLYRGDKAGKDDTPLSPRTGFIQIISSDKQLNNSGGNRRRSAKASQWQDLDKVIRDNVVALPDGKIRMYRLIFGDSRSFEAGTNREELKKTVTGFLRPDDYSSTSYA
jgi:hypothetical protein